MQWARQTHVVTCVSQRLHHHSNNRNSNTHANDVIFMVNLEYQAFSFLSSAINSTNFLNIYYIQLKKGKRKPGNEAKLCMSITFIKLYVITCSLNQYG